MANNYNLKLDLTPVTSLHNVAGADSALNTYLRDVVGNKADAIDEKVAANVSAMAYLKGLIQELDQRSVGKIIGANITDITYADVLNITDKGTLFGILQFYLGGGAEIDCTGSVKIIIDGSTEYDGIYSAEVYDSAVGFCTGGNMLSLFHKFNTSLQIQHKTSVVSKGYRTIIAYAIDT